MTGLMHFLVRHRKLSLLAVVLHVLVSTVSHESVSDLVHKVRNRTSHDGFDNTLTAIGVVVAVLLTVTVVASKYRGVEGRWTLGWGLTVVALQVVAFQTLMMFNSEAAHFPQWALLALPVYALSRRISESVLWVTLLGFVDEAYQFFADTSLYLDFNDILLNLIGASAGTLVAYLSLRRRTPPSPVEPFDLRRLVRSPAAIVVYVLVAVMLVSWLAGFLGFYLSPSGDDAPLVLSRSGAPDRIWYPTDWGKQFHVVRPWESLLWIALLVGLQALVESRLSPASPMPQRP
ncbi:MAG: hypothetical protein GY716_12600 [bacterium]|nr:hypothetical protein [bacterium]